MKLADLEGATFTVLEARSHRILLEQEQGGMPSNHFILVTAYPEAGEAYLSIEELKPVEVK